MICHSNSDFDFAQLPEMQYWLNSSNRVQDLRILDERRGATWIPTWVTEARLRGETVRMPEVEYWVNSSNRVPLDIKFGPTEWPQVKIFNLPKKTLKLQVEPEHLEVFLETIKYVKPRKALHDKYVHIIIESGYHEIIRLNWLYGRFDDANLSENFRLFDTDKSDTFDYFEYQYKNKYIARVFKCRFGERMC